MALQAPGNSGLQAYFNSGLQARRKKKPTDSGALFNRPIWCLANWDNSLVVGGSFTKINTTPANGVAAYRAGSWTALGTGIAPGFQGLYPVRSLTSASGLLFATGLFTSAGGNPADRIAFWNGANWATIAPGLNHWGYAITAQGSEVLLGGEFMSAGGEYASYVTKINSGSLSFEQFAAWPWGPVFAVTYYDDDPVANGNSGVMRYNGSAWVQILGSTGGLSLHVDGPYLYQHATQNSFGTVYRYNGTRQMHIGTMRGPVYALTTYDGLLIAAGPFHEVLGASPGNIAAWDGTSWEPIGDANNTVFALDVYDSKLIAAGAFTAIDGQPLQYLASWNGTTWSGI